MKKKIWVISFCLVSLLFSGSVCAQYIKRDFFGTFSWNGDASGSVFLTGIAEFLTVGDPNDEAYGVWIGYRGGSENLYFEHDLKEPGSVTFIWEDYSGASELMSPGGSFYMPEDKFIFDAESCFAINMNSRTSAGSEIFIDADLQLNFNALATPVPEPSTILLLGGGMVLVFINRVSRFIKKMKS